MEQELLRAFHPISVGDLSRALIAEAIVNRGRVPKVGQAVGPLQGSLVVGEEPFHVRRYEIGSALASRETEFSGVSATSRERSSQRVVAEDVVVLQTIQSCVAPGSDEAAGSVVLLRVVLVVAFRDESGSYGVLLLLLLLLLMGTTLLLGSSVGLDSLGYATLDGNASLISSRTFAGPVALRAALAAAPDVAALALPGNGLFLFILFIHFYDVILKRKKNSL